MRVPATDAPAMDAPGRPRSRIGRIATEGSASMPLMLATGYFLLNGAFMLLVAAAALFTDPSAGAASVENAAATSAARATGAVLMAGLGGLYLWTGVLLGRNARLGGILGVAMLVAALLLGVAGGTLSLMDLVLAAVGVAVLASAWRELR